MKKIIHANFGDNNNAPGFGLLTVEWCQDQGMEAGHTNYLPAQYLSHKYIFKLILFNENCYISIQISLKSVSKGPISNIPALA